MGIGRRMGSLGGGDTRGTARSSTRRFTERPNVSGYRAAKAAWDIHSASGTVEWMQLMDGEWIARVLPSGSLPARLMSVPNTGLYARQQDSRAALTLAPSEDIETNSGVSLKVPKRRTLFPADKTRIMPRDKRAPTREE